MIFLILYSILIYRFYIASYLNSFRLIWRNKILNFKFFLSYAFCFEYVTSQLAFLLILINRFINFKLLIMNFPFFVSLSRSLHFNKKSASLLFATLTKPHPNEITGVIINNDICYFSSSETNNMIPHSFGNSTS